MCLSRRQIDPGETDHAVGGIVRSPTHIGHIGGQRIGECIIAERSAISGRDLVGIGDRLSLGRSGQTFIHCEGAGIHTVISHSIGDAGI